MPFLCTIIKDALSRFIHFCAEKRVIKGFTLGDPPIEITHLQYAYMQTIPSFFFSQIKMEM